MADFTDTIIERFWAKVDRHGPDECWPWTATKGSWGHGSMRVGGRMMKASRISYQLAYGPFDSAAVVCHRCDNPPCVNPEHLFLGTQADNLADMWSKGRGSNGGRHGEKCTYTTLKAADIGAVRRRLASGASQRVIAKEFGVSQSEISRINTGKRWAGIGI